MTVKIPPALRDKALRMFQIIKSDAKSVGTKVTNKEVVKGIAKALGVGVTALMFLADDLALPAGATPREEADQIARAKAMKMLGGKK